MAVEGGGDMIHKYTSPSVFVHLLGVPELTAIESQDPSSGLQAHRERMPVHLFKVLRVLVQLFPEAWELGFHPR
jgi:hypothetical protein